MGFALAGEAARRGARSILVSGPVALATPPGVERVDVETALEMRDAVHRHAAVADLVIMAAAVADFRPRAAAASKIKKASAGLTIELEANPRHPGRAGRGRAERPADRLRGRDRRLRGRGTRQIGAQAGGLPGSGTTSRRREIGFGADDNAVTVYRVGDEPLELSRRPKQRLAGDLLTLFAAELSARGKARGKEGVAGRPTLSSTLDELLTYLEGVGYRELFLKPTAGGRRSCRPRPGGGVLPGL